VRRTAVWAETDRTICREPAGRRAARHDTYLQTKLICGAPSSWPAAAEKLIVMMVFFIGARLGKNELLFAIVRNLDMTV
jgi:hypothetical protein